MQLTDYHARYFAHELLKRCPSDSVEKLAPVLADAQPDRTDLDLLYEILLKSGFPLTVPVEAVTLADKKVFSIASGALLICLERQLTLELIRAIAELKPERVVCLDAGFAQNDQLKVNAATIFKSKGTNFKTV